VHALLRHLHSRGFHAAPRPISYDQRVETLTFVPGDTHVGWPDPLPHWIYDPAPATSAARLLRAFHDASIGFRPAEARWRIVAPTAHEVICHNDWAPYNAVFEGKTVIAMLDWDGAGPGSSVWDIARSAFVWVPLYPKYADADLPEKGRRLRAFCEAYGWDDVAAVIDLQPMQLRWYADDMERGPNSFRRDAEILSHDASALKAGAAI
jgi:Ser/Thr protein kinase RdoA (MazF antagonist)